VNDANFKGLTDYYTNTLKKNNQHMIMGVSLAFAGNSQAFTDAKKA
jgi:hypothetical protein